MPKWNPVFAGAASYEFKKKLPKDFWKILESAYGAKLDEQLRSRIAVSFLIYRHFSVDEKSLPRVDDIKKAAEDFRKAADRLLELLPAKNVSRAKLLSIQLFSLNLIKAFKPAFFRMGEGEQRRNAAPVFSYSLRRTLRFLDVLDSALLDESLRVAPQKLWKGWAASMLAALKERNYPVAISFALDKQDRKRKSQFLRLIEALQGFLPSEAYRPATTEGLAQALKRLRPKDGVAFFEEIRRWATSADLEKRLPLIITDESGQKNI